MKTRLLSLCLITGLCCFSAIVSAERVVLKSQDWLSSQEKRALLVFITECALKKDQVLVSDSSELSFEFFGKVGIAPAWNGQTNSLTDTEQRWISACVLARVNYFGTPVPFNLRTEKDSGLYTPVTESDIADFPYHEGGFFGNIFDQPQKKYVCHGDTPKNVLVGKNRLCTIPSIDGDQQVSSCGFIIVGSCDDKSVYSRDNTYYKEVFHVWLKMH